MSSEWTGLKNDPSTYPDWYRYNPPSGEKQAGRFEAELVCCSNASCSSKGRGVSEAEAFYLWAKQGFLKRLKGVSGRMYVCPFCGGSDIGPFMNHPLWERRV